MFPIHRDFRSSVVLEQVADAFKTDDQVARQLHQIGWQAVIGRAYLRQLAAILKQESRLPYGLPVISAIETEDGAVFSLNQKQGCYESGDTTITALELIELLLMSPEERDRDLFPAFMITAWDVLEESSEEAVVIHCPECGEETNNYAHGSVPNAICNCCGHEWDDETVDELKL